MPYTFGLIMLGVLGVPLVFGGAFFVHFALTSMSSKRVPGWAGVLRRFVFSLRAALVAAVAWPICIGLFTLILLFIDSRGDYWTYDGMLDGYRMPLEPPYELTMIDTLEDADLTKWKEDSRSLVGGIIEYEKRGKLMFGVTRDSFIPDSSGQDKYEWFVFDLSDGNSTTFKNKSDFDAALKLRGIDAYQLKTIQENWNEYWKDPGPKE